MLELRILNGAQALPLFDLPALLGRKQAAREVGDQIEALIAFMDKLGGDPDVEDGGDDEPAGDENDLSYPEWHTRGRKVTSGGYEMGETAYTTEDDEDSDPAEDDDPDTCNAGEDHIAGQESLLLSLGRYWDAQTIADIDREPASWPEALKQPPNMGSRGFEDDEPRWCGPFAIEAEAGALAANDA